MTVTETSVEGNHTLTHGHNVSISVALDDTSLVTDANKANDGRALHSVIMRRLARWALALRYGRPVDHGTARISLKHRVLINRRTIAGVHGCPVTDAKAYTQQVIVAIDYLFHRCLQRINKMSN